MVFVLLCLLSQFNAEYQDFINSPLSEEIFVELSRNETNIVNYAQDPVVLWFWHTKTASPVADTLLMRNNMRRNFQLSAVIRWEAQESTDDSMVYQKLRLATHLDSAAAENFMSLIVLGVRTRTVEYLQTAFSLPVFSDFRSQIFFLTNIGILLVAAIFMCAVVYILVKTVYYLPVLSHRIQPRTPVYTIDVIKTLILLIPMLIIRNLYIILIFYSILLIIVMSTREKNWLRLLLSVLIIMFVLFLPVNNFINFLKARNINHQLYEIATYDCSPELRAQTSIEKEILAYGLKQQGDLETAMSLYEELYYGGERTVGVANNLANIYQIYGEPALAESLYKTAIMVSDRGEPYYNLGLLKLLNIEYLESSRYMDEARKRNFSSLNQVPVDIKPSNTDFYRMILAEELKFYGIIKHIYVIPVILILILTFFPMKFSPPFFCTACGRPVCASCVKEIEVDTLCSTCFTKFKSTKNPELEEELRRNVGKNKRRIKTLLVVGLNLLVPGAGLIYQKKHFVGLVIVFITMLAYVPFLLSRIFVRPTGWISLPYSHVALPCAIITAIICYVLSFSLLRGTSAD
jgi:tetratricopeptide (TPR) repeat protein